MLLLLTGCAWIGTNQHDRDVATWALQFQPIERDCEGDTLIRASVSGTYDGVELALSINDQPLQLSTIEQGAVEWTASLTGTPENLVLTVSGESVEREVTLAVVTTGTQALYRDSDGDGFGIVPSTLRCPTPGWSPLPGDCDDTQAHTNPDARETCAVGDENCDGVEGLDPIDGQPFFVDLDHDGYGDPHPVFACSAPPQAVQNNLDCDDSNPDVFPDAVESCNQIDDDCDGAIDDADPNVVFPIYYLDNDGDGYGGAPHFGTQCTLEPGQTYDHSDCNDDDPLIYTGAPEYCDGVNSNCHQVDDNLDSDVLDPGLFYSDLDGDGYGAGAARLGCILPHESSLPGDCDDTNILVNPAMLEVCNGIDDDCDPSTEASSGAQFGDQVLPTLADAIDAATGSNLPIRVCGTHVWPTVLTHDIVLFGQGQAAITGNLAVASIDLVSLQGLQLIGSDSSLPVLDATDVDVVLEDVLIDCNNNTTLTDDGAGIKVTSGLVALRGASVIEGCTAALDGGGIHASGGATVFLNDTAILRDNEARRGGAIYLDNATLVVQGMGGLPLLTNNRADEGGGLFARQATALPALQYTGNRARQGAGLSLDGGSIVEVHGNFEGNIAQESGGGLHATNLAELRVIESDFRDNQALTNGGGASLSSSIGSASFNNAHFEGNQATIRGGGLFTATPTQSSSTFINNQAMDGGAIDAILADDAQLELSGLFENNSANGGNGGAIRVNATAGSLNTLLSIGDATFNNNTAVAGGAIFANGVPITIDAPVLFSFNVATSSGGGIYARAPDAIRGCGTIQLDADTTFSNNEAPIGGGLLLNTFDAAPCTLNSTAGLRFSGNSASIGAAVATRLVTPAPPSPAVPHHTLNLNVARFDGNLTPGRAALFLTSVDVECTQCSFGSDPDGQPNPNTVHDLEFSNGSFVDVPSPGGLSCSDDTTIGGCTP